MENKDFLANIAHEIRTPLNAIMGFTEILLESDYSREKQQQYLNNIAISGKHLLELVNDILYTSKIDSEKMNICYEQFETNNTINEIIMMLKPMANEKNIKINSDLSKILIEADLKKFKQIMYNLISNAIKYTNENGIIVVKSEIYNYFLKVTIQDTGIGIPAKDYENVFKRFSSINSQYSRKEESTGLGLALTKQFIKAHKGNIYFESVESKGSNFWFYIPLNRKLKLKKKLNFKMRKLNQQHLYKV